MKRRMITLLLALVLVVSLLPMASAAAQPLNVQLKGQRFLPDDYLNQTGSGFSQIGGCYVNTQYECQRCKEDPDHTDNHAVLASDVKKDIEKMQAKVDEYSGTRLVIGLTPECDHHGTPADVRVFGSYEDTELIETQPFMTGWEQLAFVVIYYSAKLTVHCDGHSDAAYDLETDSITSITTTPTTDGLFACRVVVDKAPYIEKYNQTNGTHKKADQGDTVTLDMVYSESQYEWTGNAQINVTCTPDAPAVDTIDGLAAVKVFCKANSAHGEETYPLAENTYALGAVSREDGTYVLTGKVSVPDGYVEAYSSEHGAHTLDKENSPATFKLVWDAEKGEWTLKEAALLAVKCAVNGYDPVSIALAVLNKPAPRLNTADHFAYVQGYPDGTVKPAGSITRAEVAAILFRLMDADSRSLYYSTASGFRDVDSTKWYNTYVATLNNAGVITDSRTGYFRPNDAITRAELAAMLAQFAEKKSAAIYFSDVSAGYWAANAIALTANLGWINGYPDGTFGPDKTVTRAELMAMVNRATGRAPESTGALLSGMKTWKDNADTARWYYLDVQEATNSHTYTGTPTETWTSLTATPDWSQYE